MQLSLFNIPPKYNEYFFKHFGWFPQIGKEAVIGTSFALKNFSGGSRYCFFAEVVVMEFQGDEAIVETSDREIKKLIWAGWKNPKKQTYRVKTNTLGMSWK